ncbi:hypothetical protein K525DRAFT_273897 [Schizophyllum commune Loenen D]|nr:hypothetical protein K525DRAFT_273897 [Schizophyllum commune Loenen D]
MRADLRVPTTVVPAHPTVYMEDIKTPKDTRSAHPTTEILRIVIEALGDACLLPNLRELAITGHPRLAHIEEFIQRMIPRNVPCLQYEIRPLFSSSADILVAIETHLTCLTTLTLINHTPRLPSEVFNGLHNLEMLSLARLGADSVTSLARLPRLSRLQILDLTPSDSFILDLLPNSFSSLRELDVQGPMSLVHNILASMPTLQLTTLEIKCYTDSSPRLLDEKIPYF